MHQQTYVDSYCKVAQAKLYTTKTPITAADLLNDRVLPFYEGQQLPVFRIVTDRGTEYSGNAERHDFQLYLAAYFYNCEQRFLRSVNTCTLPSCKETILT